ncbi:Repeat of Unknown Function [Acidocella aminolytica 101 = DSM 11237]|nr:Repeat of Unknown Function [Acidocella aminolytica 101 = DSM 11237]
MGPRFRSSRCCSGLQRSSRRQWARQRRIFLSSTPIPTSLFWVALAFLVALALQFTTRRHVLAAYWLLVVAVGTFGTMVVDVIHVVLGIPYVVSAVAFGIALLLILWASNAVERSLSIYTVQTPRREVFYWATVLATFGVGYFNSAVLFTVLFTVPGLTYFAFGLNEVAASWMAYILTRPMGASFADWFDKPVATGGLGYCTPAVAAALTLAVGGRFFIFACATGGSALLRLWLNRSVSRFNLATPPVPV